MTKQEIASKLERNILDRVSILLSLLPNKITNNNISKCADVCRGIEQITTDAFAEADALGVGDFFSGWRRVLIPYWSMSYGLECAYGKGFSWDRFLEYALECGCSKVQLYDNTSVPSFCLLNKSDKPEFVVALEKED